MRGKYIVLEGPEGVGKTTQIQELARRLQAAGLPVRTLREPDSQSDLTARALRQLTQDPRYPMNTNTEVLLYNAARSQSLQVIKRSVAQGVICIVDRNYLTTLAIQFYGRGDVPDYETINRIIAFAVQGVEPDLTIVMDAPVNVLRERAKFRGQGERFDNLDESFLERVRHGYLHEAKQRNLPVVNADDETEAISNNIWKLVAETLASRSSNAVVSQPESVAQILEQKKAAVGLVETAQADVPLPEPQPDTPPVRAQPSNYFIPATLPADVAKHYGEAINSILASYNRIAERLAVANQPTAPANLALPIAALYADPASLEQAGIRLQAKPQTDTSLTQPYYGDGADKPVTLADYWPRNEFSVIADALYPTSDLPLRQLQQATTDLPYEQKAEVLQRLGEANDVATQYTLDIIAEYGVALRFSGYPSSKLAHQQLTPRYGYDMPAEVEAAGADADYAACFDASLALYSYLQSAGFAAEAQLATLLGHKLRFKVNFSLSNVQQLERDAQSDPLLRPVLVAIQEQIAAVHPLLASTFSVER